MRSTDETLGFIRGVLWELKRCCFNVDALSAGLLVEGSAEAAMREVLYCLHFYLGQLNALMFVLGVEGRQAILESIQEAVEALREEGLKVCAPIDGPEPVGRVASRVVIGAALARVKSELEKVEKSEVAL